MSKLYDLRKEYNRGEILSFNLLSNPFDQFSKWFDEAATNGVEESNAVVLATVGKDCRPSARFVLIKEFDKNGFSFFTNYLSKKGRQIDENPYGALLFPWHIMQRQVRIEGKIKKLTDEKADEYFQTRPEGSRIAAWISPQSHEIQSREYFEKQAHEIGIKYQNRSIPRPQYWGGYRLIPDLFEFWQGRENRLHDRFEYFLSGNEWKMRRLAP
jgi:pyridoxamine 5'-phosphate oxidase